MSPQESASPAARPPITTARVPRVFTSSLDVLKDIRSRAPEVEIRDEQIDALDAIQENEAEGNNASLVVMAPGLGKTTVMAADTLRRLSANPGARVLSLCDKNDILLQQRERFERLIGPDYSYGLFSGDGRDYDEMDVLFGSFQVMRKWRDAFLSNEFAYGLVDESHHTMAPTYEPTIRYFEFDHLLGVTATPDRLDVRDIRNVYGPEAYSMLLEEAIAKGKLAAVDYHVLTDEIMETEQLRDIQGNRYSLKELDRTVFVPKRDEEIMSLIHSHARKIKGDVKRIIFCKSIQQAEQYSKYFSGSVAIHSDLGRDEAKRSLEAFRGNGQSTLLAVDMFNEGLDIPDANQIVFLRNTASKAVYLQQLGRGLRKTPNKKRVQVLDFVANCDRLMMVDRVWRDIGTHVAGAEPGEDETDLTFINVGSVHFNESARRILPLLRRISGRVYDENQNVPLGAKRLVTVAREANFTLPGLIEVAKAVGIAISHFPSRRGNVIPYVTPENAARLHLSAQRMRKSRRQRQ